MLRKLAKNLFLLPHIPVIRTSSKSICGSQKLQKAIPELTSKRYPNIKRGHYARLTSADIDYFRSVLVDDGALAVGDDTAGYNQDWLNIVRGQSECVLKPKTTEQVSSILTYCNDRGIAVCTQGGNTGLVGGSVPVFDEVVLSTQRMNKILSLDPVSGILTCQSGCILESLDDHLSAHGLMTPLDLGAKGSCHIGGNVSTNAGGIRLLRYGSLHGSVLGVEAVLASGEVVDCLSTLRKDNTGYDVKQLFIGSEGTLGVVTAVSLLCPPRPKAQTVALLACDTFDAVVKGMTFARGHLGEILSAYEFMDDYSMQCVVNNLGLSNPIVTSPFYALVETSGSNGTHDEQKMTHFLQVAMDDGCVTDGTVATDVTKIKSIWQLRESIAEALLHDGYCYKYDISLPLSQYYPIVEDLRARLQGHAVTVCGYGHVADGNLHFNATSREFSESMRSVIEPYIYDVTAAYRGSVSAEHGLGLLKSKYIYHSKSRPAVKMMKQIKQLMDPKAILNPYKTLPED